jgi:hypothetical protein
MFPRDIKQLHTRYRQTIEQSLRKDRRRLLKALEEFANLRPDKDAWRHFRKRWPDFFPSDEYDKVFDGSVPNIHTHLDWLDALWQGDTEPPLAILLGIESPPDIEGLDPALITHEDAFLQDLTPIRARWLLDWDKADFVYIGACDFQRALYLLFRESWRARVCRKCPTKFIAKRAAQKYCSTVCSLAAQLEHKNNWWKKNGGEWRKDRNVSLN